MEIHDYAIKALTLAEENHISINGFSIKTDDFFINLGRTVYDMAENGRKLDIYSFGEYSNMKLPGKTSFIEINIS